MDIIGVWELTQLTILKKTGPQVMVIAEAVMMQKEPVQLPTIKMALFGTIAAEIMSATEPMVNLQMITNRTFPYCGIISKKRFCRSYNVFNHFNDQNHRIDFRFAAHVAI